MYPIINGIINRKDHRRRTRTRSPTRLNSTGQLIECRSHFPFPRFTHTHTHTQTGVLPRKRGHDVISTDRSSDGAPSPTPQFEIVLTRYCGIMQHFFGASAHVEDIPRKHWRVCSSAIVYFRRFYLHHTLFDHDPRLIVSVPK
jgi:hypothetical protein